MRLAICNEIFADSSFPDVCRAAAQLGYEGIELAPFTLGGRPNTVSPNKRRQVRRAAEDAGLEIIGLHWLLANTSGLHLTSPDAQVRRLTAQYLVQLGQLCHDVGGKVMVLGSPQQRSVPEGVTGEGAWQFAIDVIEFAAPTLERLGVVLALEPLGPEETDFLNTASEAIEMVRRIDSPAVRLHLDAKALVTEADEPPQVIRQSAPWLVHFHANDPNRRGPGMGRMDFRPILAALHSIGYAGWVSVEPMDLALGAEETARQSIEYLRRLAGGAFECKTKGAP